MRFGTWNVKSLYRAASFMTATRELARYKLYLVGVQEVRWDRGKGGWGSKSWGLYRAFHNILRDYKHL